MYLEAFLLTSKGLWVYPQLSNLTQLPGGGVELQMGFILPKYSCLKVRSLVCTTYPDFLYGRWETKVILCKKFHLHWVFSYCCSYTTMNLQLCSPKASRSMCCSSSFSQPAEHFTPGCSCIAVSVRLTLSGLSYLAFIFNKCSDFKETLLMFFVTRHSLWDG